MKTVTAIITKGDLTRCKRAVVVLAEISKASMQATKLQAPLELKEDMLALTKLLRRLESIATE